MDSERLLVTDDDDLDAKSKKDDYQIKRLFKYLVLLIVSIILIALTIMLVVAICTDTEVRDYAIKAVLNGLPGISVAALAILGFRDLKK
jgi:formate hydrogenlyase subunit 3/multisubunit Na+/H+ antiporter MnhD subunit